MSLQPDSLALASCLLVGGTVTSVGAAAAGTTSTTVYVGRHFEVRAVDQPVKYVFSGDTRVARITGTLNGGQRIQRLRLQPGWNLCALAVGEARLPAHPTIDRAHRWDAAIQEYHPVLPQESLPAGTVLWIRATAPAVVSVKGTPPASGPSTVPADGGLAGNGALEATSLQLPAGVTVWKFDAANQRWQAALAGDLATIQELPPKLAPGEAIYLHASEPIQLPAIDPAKQVAYYHQDHLGSSSVITDAAGSIAEETAFHPFGAVRHQERLAELETYYGFTQKEQDQESRLHYFEARYLGSGLARFLSPDPKFLHPDQLEERALNEFLRQPERRHLLAYARNKPVNHFDPDGQEDRPRQAAAPALPRSSHYLNLVQYPDDPDRSIRPALGPKSSFQIVSLWNKRIGGNNAQSPDFEIVISRPFDGVSPEILENSRRGQEFAFITLEIEYANPGFQDDIDIMYRLSDVHITDYVVALDSSGDAIETFRLSGRTSAVYDFSGSRKPVPLPYPNQVSNGASP